MHELAARTHRDGNGRAHSQTIIRPIDRVHPGPARADDEDQFAVWLSVDSQRADHPDLRARGRKGRSSRRADRRLARYLLLLRVKARAGPGAAVARGSPSALTVSTSWPPLTRTVPADAGRFSSSLNLTVTAGWAAVPLGPGQPRMLPPPARPWRSRWCQRFLAAWPSDLRRRLGSLVNTHERESIQPADHTGERAEHTALRAALIDAERHLSAPERRFECGLIQLPDVTAGDWSR